MSPIPSFWRACNKFTQTEWPFVILLSLLTLFEIWGIPAVPFHPDEATQLYMSSDFETLFTQPATLFWQPDNHDDPRQSYRELDAPLTKYLLGFGRMLAGQAAPHADWNWSQPWDENLQSSAYPTPETLFAGRLAITLLLPLSLTLIYLIGKQIHSRSMGLVAMLLLGTHAVTLLHGRRAMAEGPLLFGVLFATWCLIWVPKRPWLIGLSLAIAFNAKQSALALVPVGIIAILWSAIQENDFQKKKPKSTWFQLVKKISWDFSTCGMVFIAISFLLNPLHWRSPLQSIRSAINAREDLLENQIQDLRNIAPEKYLAIPTHRITMLIANVFIGPAEHSLVGNLSATREEVDAYIAMPGHNLFRGFAWGSFFLVLTILGFILAIRSIIKTKFRNSYTLGILILATIFQAGALIAVVPLPWVRFTLPIIPFSCLWAAFGVAKFLNNLRSG